MSHRTTKREEEHTCPTCGRDDFANEKGMKNHHVIKHGVSLAKEKHDEYDCEWCECTFSRSVSESADKPRFCSQECYRDWQRKSSPNEYYGKLTPKRHALRRDEFRCQRCGVEVEEGHRESENCAEIHHIIPVSAGGPNVAENLITLCFSCHTEAHSDFAEIHERAPEAMERLREVVTEGADAESSQT